MKSIDSSLSLIHTRVPAAFAEPRTWYLENYAELEPPCIAHSFFIPDEMVSHLMRNKKDSALGVKFMSSGHSPPDQITNMEGALHTFVTPIVNAVIHGDYQWKYGHSIHRFGYSGATQFGRRVLLSALVQQDFENREVMVHAARLEEAVVMGVPELPEMLDIEAKQNDADRSQYDRRIRQCLVHHLVASHQLPPAASVPSQTMTKADVLDFLRSKIMNVGAQSMQRCMEGQFFHCQIFVLSLEFMFNAALHQVVNEFTILEQLCPEQGYVFTWNPPKIFAQALQPDGTKLLSLLHIAALKHFASTHPLSLLRCIAWDDFGSPEIIDLLQHAFSSHKHVQIKKRAELFPQVPEEGTAKGGRGLYRPSKELQDAVLVIHNNSDAFGQNIETEMYGTSLDGVIGACSSAAGSLLRQRKDLCDNLVRIEAS